MKLKLKQKTHTQHITEGEPTDELDINILDDPELCPECRTRTIILDEEKCEEYCTQCGTITRAASRYVAGKPIELAYGLIII